MNTRRFSRHLPPLQREPLGLRLWLVLMGFAIWFLAVLYSYPVATVSTLLVLVGANHMLCRRSTRRTLALAATRPGNPLCTFARALDLRAVDPWVVRATFEELQTYFPQQAQPFPIRPTDKMVDDLDIDPDDINFIAQDIAERAGYSLESSQQNPLYGKVETVGELIQFFTHQPKPLRGLRDAASGEG